MTAAGPAHVLLDQPERPEVPCRADPRRGRQPGHRRRPRGARRRPCARRGDRPGHPALPGQGRPRAGVRAQAGRRLGGTRRGVAPGDRAGRRALPLVQCGRSNGARVACRTARQVGAAGVIALAFPLHPPGQPGKSRDQELRGAGTSVLVINGERDPFGVPEPDETDERRRAPRGNARPLEASGGDRRCRHRLAERAAVPGEVTLLQFPGTMTPMSRRGSGRAADHESAIIAWRGGGFLVTSLGGWRLMVGGPVRGDRGPVWQQLTSVFKDHDPVAEQRPALLRVAHNRVRRLAVWCRRFRTGR